MKSRAGERRRVLVVNDRGGKPPQARSASDIDREDGMAHVALVTGGTRGIGAAIARALKEAGHDVAVNYAGNDDAARAFADSTGLRTYKWDVGDYDACAAGVAAVERDLGPVSILVNNAGITRDGFFHKMTREQWKAVLTTNLDSLFNMTRPVIEGMRNRGWGRIVVISSINGQKGQLGQVKALAQENAGKNVTVNAICPGYIGTDMVRAVDPEVLKSRILPQIPAGRLGEPEEIGALVRYLCSDAAAFMTGSTLSINGGQYMT
jgi:acetoacetyl-CoA reductase